jgi:hypothetical protein
MNHRRQRLLAKRDMPFLADTINSMQCYNQIFATLHPSQHAWILENWSRKWPLEWALRWARYYKTYDAMLPRLLAAEPDYESCGDWGDDEVSLALWAYQCPLQDGDREKLRDRVTHGETAMTWLHYFPGDKDVMRSRIVTPHQFKLWLYKFLAHEAECDWVLGSLKLAATEGVFPPRPQPYGKIYDACSAKGWALALMECRSHLKRVEQAETLAFSRSNPNISVDRCGEPTDALPIIG